MIFNFFQNKKIKKLIQCMDKFIIEYIISESTNFYKRFEIKIVNSSEEAQFASNRNRIVYSIQYVTENFKTYLEVFKYILSVYIDQYTKYYSEFYNKSIKLNEAKTDSYFILFMDQYYTMELPINKITIKGKIPEYSDKVIKFFRDMRLDWKGV